MSSSDSFDPFARVAFYPSAADVDARAQGLADEAVRVAAREFGVALDFGAESIRRVDAMLEDLHGRRQRGELDDDAMRTYARLLGSYAGEVVRRSHGGTWGVVRVYGDAMTAVRVNELADPFVAPTLATVRIERGEGQTLWDAYQEVVRVLTADPAVAEALRRELVKPRARYRLRHDTGYFETGLVSRGRQVLTGFFVSGPIAIYFDARGRLLNHEVLPLPMEMPRHPTSALPYHTPEFDAAVERVTDAWKAKVKFFAAPIQVQRFEIAGLGVGIADRPEHFEHFLSAPEAREPGEDSRRELIESVRQWEEGGCFVLYWGNDLWINGEGEVTAS